MATEYSYIPCKFELEDRLLEAIDRVKGEYSGPMYWLGQTNSSSGTLLQLSSNGKSYKYAYVTSRSAELVDIGTGPGPYDRWLNPAALVYLDKQLLPFSWRS